MSLPHYYTARADASEHGEVRLTSGSVAPISSTLPPEFGGPDGRWSPETLLSAAIGDCVVLTFRAVARAAKFPFTNVSCEVRGQLDRADGITSFVDFQITVRLSLAPGASPEQAEQVLMKTKDRCLITNSLKGTSRFVAHIAPVPAIALERTA
jgi:uncharacterized OsmC-like protein